MKKLLALVLCCAFMCAYLPALGEEETPPPEIQQMITLAQEQLEKHGGKRLEKSNEYTKWYYGDKTKIEWCGAFTTWLANQAGVPMIKEAQIESYVAGNVNTADMKYEPIESIPDMFLMYEVNIMRVRNGYSLAERLVTIPKPGYQIIYGKIGGGASYHTGIVETVREISDGVWELTTIEGNVGSKIKRYCTRYTLEPKRKHHNFTAVPSKERVVENAEYKLQNENWYISGFGRTW